MTLIDLTATSRFSSDKPYQEILYDSPNLRVVAFNFQAGQELPVHSHKADSEVALLVLEGEGKFLGDHELPAQTGTLLIIPVSTPHGLKAHTALRLLVYISPTL
jgi:quercetin dioxygenase-like cupin family protein